jgi:hypothetical protein
MIILQPSRAAAESYEDGASDSCSRGDGELRKIMLIPRELSDTQMFNVLLRGTVTVR